MVCTPLLPKVRSRYIETWKCHTLTVPSCSRLHKATISFATRRNVINDNHYSYSRPQLSTFHEACRYPRTECADMACGWKSDLHHFRRRYVHGIETWKCHTLNVPRCRRLLIAACRIKLQNFYLLCAQTRPNRYSFGEAANRLARAVCRIKVSHFVCAALLLKVRSRYWNLKMPYLDCTLSVIVSYAV